ncbi:MAG: hypothetical protein KDD73_13240 [Anaerolineales bacterium]|nr:hypothetical protein [Anaerolineales bacterium]
MTNNYGYAANGNMTVRQLGSTCFDLIYDTESRLVEVKTNSARLEIYTYDGDGGRIKVVSGCVTTIYIGDYYEYRLTASAGSEGEGITPPPTVTSRRYYYAGTLRIAVGDSALGRFTQTDTIVPEPNKPVGFGYIVSLYRAIQRQRPEHHLPQCNCRSTSFGFSSLGKHLTGRSNRI